MNRAKNLLQSWQSAALASVGLAVLYWCVARLLVAVPDVDPYTAPVWVPLGISLAALLHFGAAIAPGAWLGEFWFARSMGLPVGAAIGTAIAAVLAGWAGAKLLRWAQFDPSLTQQRDIAALILLGGGVAAPIHTLLRTVSLGWSGVYAGSGVWQLAGQSWCSDALAMLLVTPALLTWLTPTPRPCRSLLSRYRWVEIGLWLGLLLSLSSSVLMSRQVGLATYPTGYLLFPPVVWAALRFGLRGTTLASLLISAIALWGMIQGGSPFLLGAVDSRGTQALQTFMGVVSITGLFLAATVAERRHATAQLRQLAETLDQQVHERTQQLRESEARARRLMESNLIGIGFWDGAGNIVEANRAFCDLLGYDVGEAGSLSWQSIAPGSSELDLTAIVQQTAEQGPIEVQYRRKDGTLIPVLMGAAYLEGTAESSVSFVLDLSAAKRLQAEQQQTQAALWESERRFRRLAESNIFGVAFGDFNGNIHYINDYLLQMLGCDREALLSGRRRWASMTPPEFLPLDLQAAGELQRRGACTPYEKEFICADGRRVPVLIGAALLQEPSNNQQEIVAFCVDLSQLKQTEAALRQSEAEVAALNQDLQRRVDELQTLFEVIPIGIAIAEDAVCQHIRINAAFAQMLGMAPACDSATLAAEQLPQVRVFRSGQELTGDQLPLQFAASHRAEVSGIEMDVVREDGTVLNLFGCASPLLDERGNSRGAISAFLDITERKRSEAKYAQLLLLEQAARSEAEAAQRRLATIFETSPVGLGFLDRDQRFVAINEALAEINGFSPEQHLGRSIADLFGQSESRLVEIFQQVYETGKPFIAPSFAFDVPGRTDRRPGYYNVYYLPDITPDGAVESVLIYTLDVTDRVRLEQRELFLANASMVLAASLDYEVTLQQLANLAVPELADWCAVDVLEDSGEVRRLAIAHADPEKAAWAWEIEQRYPSCARDRQQGVPQVLRTGQAEVYTQVSDQMLQAAAQNAEHLEILRQLGFRSMMILPLKIGGVPQGTISLFTAESGRRYGSAELSLAEELARRAAQALDNAKLYWRAQDLNRVKDEFLAVLSHELRSPLNGILGWAQMLRRGTLNAATQARAIETIERNARAQVQLIDDLLDISRIIRGKLRLEVRPVALAPIIEAAIDAMRPAAQAKDIQLQTQLSPAARLVAGDPERLQQVLWNLLSNAIKFTPRGGWVRVTLEQTPSNVEITVCDSGKGISPEFLPYVFERFRQADSSLTRAYGGLGLGLAIVRHLVELHGGTVQVSSEGEGRGASFTVQLPSATQALANSPTPVSPADEPTDAERSLRLDGVRVLVIDDEADARDLVITILQTAGATVTAAASAASALDVLVAVQPHVLVSDIGMPGEDGYGLIRQVRARSPQDGGRVPAVALTAYARDEDRRRALLLGFQAHVPKPVNSAELVSVVASLVGRAETEEAGS